MKNQQTAKNEVDQMFNNYNPEQILFIDKGYQPVNCVILNDDNSVREFLIDAYAGKYSYGMVKQIQAMR